MTTPLCPGLSCFNSEKSVSWGKSEPWASQCGRSLVVIFLLWLCCPSWAAQRHVIFVVQMSHISTPLRHIPLALLHGKVVECLLFTQSAKKVQMQLREGACSSHRLITTNGPPYFLHGGQERFEHFISNSHSIFYHSAEKKSYSWPNCWESNTLWFKVLTEAGAIYFKGDEQALSCPFLASWAYTKDLVVFLLQGSQHLPGRKKTRFWRDLF